MSLLFTEEAHEMKFSSEDFAQRIKRKGQELLRYHVSLPVVYQKNQIL